MSEGQQQAMTVARGCYQRALIQGTETLGGSTLRGRARSYTGRYEQSARSLLRRLREAGVAHHVQLGPRGGWHSARLVID
jgi:hypothetical protein